MNGDVDYIQIICEAVVLFLGPPFLFFSSVLPVVAASIAHRTLLNCERNYALRYALRPRAPSCFDYLCVTGKVQRPLNTSRPNLAIASFILLSINVDWFNWIQVHVHQENSSVQPSPGARRWCYLLSTVFIFFA